MVFRVKDCMFVILFNQNELKFFDYLRVDIFVLPNFFFIILPNDAHYSQQKMVLS